MTAIDSFLKKASKTISKQGRVLEEDIEKPFVSFCKKKGCIAYKLIILNRRGFPDRTVLCPGGVILFIEFKRKNKKPTETQIRVRSIIEGLGFKYYVCDEKGQAEQILMDVLLGIE